MDKPQEGTSSSSKHIQLKHEIIKFPTYTFTGKNYIHKTYSKVQDTQHSQFNSHTNTWLWDVQKSRTYLSVHAAILTKIIEIHNYSRVYHKSENGTEEGS